MIRQDRALYTAEQAAGGEQVYAQLGGGRVTYSVDGTQYIAAASGSPSNFWSDEFDGAPTMVVFKLS